MESGLLASREGSGAIYGYHDWSDRKTALWGSWDHPGYGTLGRLYGVTSVEYAAQTTNMERHKPVEK